MSDWVADAEMTAHNFIGKATIFELQARESLGAKIFLFLIGEDLWLDTSMKPIMELMGHSGSSKIARTLLATIETASTDKWISTKSVAVKR